MYMIAEVSQYVAVASFLEAWIEIIHQKDRKLPEAVASFLEAWIEIRAAVELSQQEIESPPSWRRGLKLNRPRKLLLKLRRLLLGGVD